MKGYKILKIIIALYFCNLLVNSLAMITQFLQMSFNEIMMLLRQNILQNTCKFLLHSK